MYVLGTTYTAKDWGSKCLSTIWSFPGYNGASWSEGSVWIAPQNATAPGNWPARFD